MALAPWSRDRALRMHIGVTVFTRIPVPATYGRKLNSGNVCLTHNKFLQSDQSILSCLLLAQKPRQHALAAEERRYESNRVQIKRILGSGSTNASQQLPECGRQGI